MMSPKQVCNEANFINFNVEEHYLIINNNLWLHALGPLGWSPTLSGLVL